MLTSNNVWIWLYQRGTTISIAPTDFMLVSSLFLVSNVKKICKNDKIHGRKLQTLIPNTHEKSIIDNISHDPNKVI